MKITEIELAAKAPPVFPAKYEGRILEDRLPTPDKLKSWYKWKGYVDANGPSKSEIALIKTNKSGRGHASDYFWITGYLVHFKSGGSLLLSSNHNGNVVMCDKGFHPYVLFK
jgi:hypothetical protein